MFEQFATQTGFKGDFTLTDDGRLFSKMQGKFNLPVPQDSIALCNNLDVIVSNLDAIYRQNGADYVLKRTSYQKDYNSCQYVQYWKNFFLTQQPFYLLIVYNSETDTYTIYNKLYMGKIELPDNAVSFKTAAARFKVMLNPTNLNYDLDSIPLEYSRTDTMHTVYSYENYYTLTIVLNLYPSSDKADNPQFRLQWKHAKAYDGPPYITDNFLMDAVSGEPTWDAKTRWDKHSGSMRIISQFISKAKLEGKCRAYFDSYDQIRLESDSLESVAINDTIAFNAYADNLVRLYLRIFRTSGYDYDAEPYQSFVHKNGTSGYFERYYYQAFRYQIYPAGEFGYGVIISYSSDSRKLSLSSRFFDKPLTFPDKVLSPRSILDLFILNWVNNNSNRDFRDDFPLKYAPADKFTRHNSYRDDKYFLTARLSLLPIPRYSYDSIDLFSDLKLVWQVKSDYSNDYDSYFDAVTGGYARLYSDIDYTQKVYSDSAKSAIIRREKHLIEAAFFDLGTTSDLGFDSYRGYVNAFSLKSNLPEPADSLLLLQNYDTIMRHILKYKQLNSVDYTWIKDPEFFPSDYYQKSFRLCYKSFPIPGTQVIIEYSPYSDYKYRISCNIISFSLKETECVITPDTALKLIDHDADLTFAWTAAKFLSGMQNYAPPELYTPAEESARDEEYRGSIRLSYYKIKTDGNKSDKIVYKLVWIIYPYDGAEFIIDAETGKILSENYWDTC